MNKLMLYSLLTIAIGCSGSGTVSVSSTAVPSASDRYWTELEEKIVDWDSKTLRQNDNVEQYVTFCPLFTSKNGKLGSVQFGLSTAKAKPTIANAGPPPDWNCDSSCSVEKTGVFVMPPGVFVQDVRDAIPIWRANFDDAFVELKTTNGNN